MKSPLKVISRISAKPLISGLFSMHDTFGFPLAFSIIECDRLGACPDIPGFYCDARKAGWSQIKTENFIFEAISDARGRDEMNWFISNVPASALEILFMQQHAGK